MTIRIFTCGGTIDKVYFDAKGTYEVGTPQIETVLNESNVTTDYCVEPILQKDSLEMADDDRSVVCEKVQSAAEKRVLITHGTDTMINTAKALKSVEGKTIVLTGSVEPARFKVSDAMFNIGCAFGAVQTLPEGVYIAMNGQVFDPEKVRLNNVQNRFEETE